MIKYIAFASAALAAAAVPGSALAVPTVLDFSGNICGVAGNLSCGNGSEIGQNYGDSAIQNVSYRSIVNATGVTYENYLKHWGTGYGNLANVVWGGADAVNYRSEITFTPLAGYEVSLTSFQGACYQNRTNCQTFPYSVLYNGGQLLTSGTITPPASGNTLVTLNTAYTTGPLLLVWGPDGYDGGLTNITFDVRAVATGVPEPTAWALMIGGFGLVGGLQRRRRSTGHRPFARI